MRSISAGRGGIDSVRVATNASRPIVSIGFQRVSKPMVEADLATPPVPYTASGSYRPGQRVDHPAFGPGVVERVLASTKVQVFFATGSRVLAQRRD